MDEQSRREIEEILRRAGLGDTDARLTLELEVDDIPVWSGSTNDPATVPRILQLAGVLPEDEPVVSTEEPADETDAIRERWAEEAADRIREVDTSDGEAVAHLYGELTDDLVAKTHMRRDDAEEYVLALFRKVLEESYDWRYRRYGRGSWPRTTPKNDPYVSWPRKWPRNVYKQARFADNPLAPVDEPPVDGDEDEER